MSIRFRLTLLYTFILALTLVAFSTVLYVVQSGTTLRDHQTDLIEFVRRVADGPRRLPEGDEPPENPEPELAQVDDRTIPFYVQERSLSGDIVQAASADVVLPLDEAALQQVAAGQPRFDTITIDAEPWLVYSQRIATADSQEAIIQVARSLADRARFLSALRLVLTSGSLIALLMAFGSGWLLSGASLQPIKRIAGTAQLIGLERDFGRRVDYTGPNDEIGQLATTFNAMLTELQAAYSQVAQSLQAQQRFVADASHELRTPLTTIRGNIDLLQREPPIPAQDRDDILVDIRDETERLMRLVHDLLALARLDAGRDLKQVPVALPPLLETVCRQRRLLSPEREIDYEALPDVQVMGDPDALKQIFLILLDNGLKHTPPDAKIRLTVAATDQTVSVGIRDTGPGIDPTQLPHLFKRFYRGDAARTGNGAGLGLAIAAELVAAQNGSLQVESELGKGSVFTVTMPRIQT